MINNKIIINIARKPTILERIYISFEIVTSSVEKIIKAKNGEYTSFRVTAYILFDEYKVKLYESELFEKGKKEPDGRTLREMKKELNSALAYYQSI